MLIRRLYASLNCALPIGVFSVSGFAMLLSSFVSEPRRACYVCEDVSMINANVTAALLYKGSLPLNNAVPLL